ncbi:hypothetical protein ACB098_08G126700 [Castanea mollissima]
MPHKNPYFYSHQHKKTTPTQNHLLMHISETRSNIYSKTTPTKNTPSNIALHLANQPLFLSLYCTLQKGFQSSLSHMSSNKKNILKTIFSANVACGCARPKSSDVFEPIRRPKVSTNNENQKPCTSSSSSRNGGLSVDEDLTSTTISEPETDIFPKSSKKISSSSIAVEKVSDNPYQDFRQSMLQMILEKEIYSKDDLQELLNCFLRLNSPCHHDVIIRAFKEIWDEVVSHRLILQKPSVPGNSNSRES